MSKLMRISDASVDALNDLNLLTGESRQKILDKAIALYKHEQLLLNANEQLAALKKDPVAWKQMQEEQEDWNVTLLDGLSDEK